MTGEKRPGYVAGVCNIGEYEITRRRRFGLLNLAATLLIITFLVLIGADPVWRLLIFFPAFGAAIGFIQARMHFCAYFGLSSLFNFGEAGSSPEEVWEAELRRQDRRRAWTIIGYSLLIALGMTVAACLLPQ